MNPYALAHGAIQLHLQTEAGRRVLPAALYHDVVGEEALHRGGPRIRRVARWDAEGWETWWELLGQVAEDRPIVAAIPALQGQRPGHFQALPESASWRSATALPPTVALRAASTLPAGTALYLGAFAWEMAAFSAGEMEEPETIPGGLEPLYRSVIAEVFQKERRPLLPLQVPGLLREGYPLPVEMLLDQISRFLPASGGAALGKDEGLPEGPDAPTKTGPISAGAPGKGVVLGGEDDVVVQALVQTLTEQGHTVIVADPLEGLEKLLAAAVFLEPPLQPHRVLQ
jgi:hypothetical protein